MRFSRIALWWEIFIVALVALVFAASWAPSLGGSGHGAYAPGSDLFAPQVPEEVGAPPGYGLLNASRLQPHAPIYIDNDSGFTAANGVTGGKGTAGDPYVISNWLIDGNLYPGAEAMIWFQNTFSYVVVENVRLVNLNGLSQGAGVQLGNYPNIVYTENVVIRHNEITGRHAYGIWINEGSSNVSVEGNLVRIDANRDWVYGAVAMRGTHDVTFYGNYIDARSDSYLTVGIHLSDYFVGNSRRATNLVAERNTIINATASGIHSESSLGNVIGGNLVYQNYPGRKTIGNWTVRGISTAERSNYTRIYNNVVFNAENGIEIGSSFDTVYGNVIHDVTVAVFIDPDGSWPAVKWTFNDSVYDTTYWNVTTNFVVPTGGRHTVLDVGAGVTPTNFSTTYFVSNQTASEIAYQWSGTVFNLSMLLGTRVIYDRQASSASENLGGRWTGSNLQLQVSQFTPDDVIYNLRSGTNATFQGAQFALASYYLVSQSAQPLATVLTDVSGNLSFGMPSPVSASYEIRFASAVPPPAVTIVAPANDSYVTSPSVQVAWVVNETGPGLRSVVLTVDDGAGMNVTGATDFTVSGLLDGKHVVRIAASDLAGLVGSQEITIVVDTEGPVVNILTPTNNATINTTSLLVVWNATDLVSGLSKVDISLDNGPYAPTSGDNYSLIGLSQGIHGVDVRAVDNAGLSTTTAALFTVNSTAPPSGNTTSSGNASAAPAISSVVYLPEASSVEIAFTQPMNHTSVETALSLSPDVEYSVVWVDDEHVRLVIESSLDKNVTYQIVLSDSARGNAGAPLQHPFLFQFLASPPPGTAVESGWAVILLAVVAFLVINWATAGLLVYHYRRNTQRVRSILNRITKRYGGSLVIVYKRLARGVEGGGRPAGSRTVPKRGPARGRTRKPVLRR